MTDKAKMKIALVCPASLPATQFGGIMFLCVDIAREIAKAAHDVTIFTTDLDFANNPHTFNKKLPKLESIQGFKINRSHVWFWYQLFYINPMMYYEMKREKPDIIHAIGIRSFQTLIAALISKKYKIPLILSDQGGLTTHPDLTNSGVIKKILYRMQTPIIKFIIKQASYIIVPNEYEQKIFANYKDNSKIFVVKNGINLDNIYENKINFKNKYGITQDFVLFLGRFNRIKGIDTLLHAWSIIAKESEIEKIDLVIMGVDFGFETEMKKMIRELKIEKNIRVITKPPRDDVLAAYSTCQFLVLPSRWELSPLTPLEGFAFKKPTISTNVHGIPHTIKDGENAILVEPEDHIGLAKAILELLRNDNMRQKYGAAGYTMVQEVCNSRIMGKSILHIYEQINKISQNHMHG